MNPYPYLMQMSCTRATMNAPVQLRVAHQQRHVPRRGTKVNRTLFRAARVARDYVPSQETVIISSELLARRPVRSSSFSRGIRNYSSHEPTATVVRSLAALFLALNAQTPDALSRADRRSRRLAIGQIFPSERLSNIVRSMSFLLT